MRNIVEYLSSERMQGRANGSKELETAAAWLATQYRAVGLRPYNGVSYFQPFTVRRQGRLIGLKNVIGILEGSDDKLKHEYIILSAHYDHLGIDRTRSGDRVFNGADDDASGVAAILGIAAAIRKSNVKHKRTIVIIAWSGEEIGMAGSRYYRDHPAFPLDRTVTNINFEMVGRSSGSGRRRAWMTGAELSELMGVINSIAGRYGWRIGASPYPGLKLFFRSDNTPLAFIRIDRARRRIYGIPAHSLSTWGREGHYHKVSDEARYIDYRNLSGLVGLFSRVVVKLANLGTWIEWKQGNRLHLRRYMEN